MRFQINPSTSRFDHFMYLEIYKNNKENYAFNANANAIQNAFRTVISAEVDRYGVLSLVGVLTGLVCIFDKVSPIVTDVLLISVPITFSKMLGYSNDGEVNTSGPTYDITGTTTIQHKTCIVSVHEGNPFVIYIGCMPPFYRNGVISIEKVIPIADKHI